MITIFIEYWRFSMFIWKANVLNKNILCLRKEHKCLHVINKLVMRMSCSFPVIQKMDFYGNDEPKSQHAINLRLR